jgi:hypothetical protein
MASRAPREQRMAFGPERFTSPEKPAPERLSASVWRAPIVSEYPWANLMRGPMASD